MAHSYYADYMSFAGLKFDQTHDSLAAPFIESITANDLRIGKYCMISGFPCKVRELNRSKPGKHGHAKLRTVGQGIFDSKKRETIFAAHDMVQTPIIHKLELQCAVKTDGLELQYQDKRFPCNLAVPPEEDSIQKLHPERTDTSLLCRSLWLADTTRSSQR